MSFVRIKVLLNYKCLQALIGYLVKKEHLRKKWRSASSYTCDTGGSYLRAASGPRYIGVPGFFLSTILVREMTIITILVRDGS